MEKSVSKRGFFIFFGLIFLSLVAQIGYLSSHPKNTKLLNDFLDLSSLNGFAFYSNTPYLRHRDLKNADTLFGLHPSLRENKLGTFILSNPVRKK
ncbi:MAG: hypothetical protein CR967_03655 [Proteobacteria bacterium]|nr:MAG: hypothetical protein CR967_03655 [Pseudomonadota bacterium]